MVVMMDTIKPEAQRSTSLLPPVFKPDERSISANDDHGIDFSFLSNDDGSQVLYMYAG